jgi:outer membrane biogenesis lipoprotein LolB
MKLKSYVIPLIVGIILFGCTGNTQKQLSVAKQIQEKIKAKNAYITTGEVPDPIKGRQKKLLGCHLMESTKAVWTIELQAPQHSIFIKMILLKHINMIKSA